jgi:hypothetical protein
MREESRHTLLFTIYILIVLVLAVTYFTVPERADFIDFQVRWWKELWLSIRSFSP